MSVHAQKKRKLISDEESEAIRSVARSAYEQHKQEQHQSKAMPRQAPLTGQQQKQLPSLDELQRAPRFGLNARALILQAAGAVVGPNDSCHLSAAPAAPPNPKPPSMPAGAPPPNLPARLNPTRLLEAVSVPERHFVTFVPRSNIPRLLRQGTADMLLGRYLSHLVGLCQHATPVGQRTEAKALEAVRTDADLRATARLTAAAHETALYKQVTSKHAYTALSTNPECSLATLRLHAPADRLEQLLSKYGSSTAAAFAPPPAVAPPAASAPPRPCRQAVSEDTHDLFDSSSSSEEAEGSSEEDGSSSSEEVGSKGGDDSQSLIQTGPVHEHSSIRQQTGNRGLQQKEEAPVELKKVGSPSPKDSVPGDECPSVSRSEARNKQKGAQQNQEQAPTPGSHETSSPVQDPKVLEPPACSAGGDTEPDGQQQQQQQQQGEIDKEPQRLPEQVQQQQQQQRRQRQQVGSGGGLSPSQDHQRKGGCAAPLGPQCSTEQHGPSSGHQEQLGCGEQNPGGREGEGHELHEGRGGREGRASCEGVPKHHEDQPGCHVGLHGSHEDLPGWREGQPGCREGQGGHEDLPGHQEARQSKAAVGGPKTSVSLQHEEHTMGVGPQEELQGEDLQGTCQGPSAGSGDGKGGHDDSRAEEQEVEEGKEQEEQEEEAREQEENVGCNRKAAEQQSSHGRGGEKGGRHRSRSSRARDSGEMQHDDEGGNGCDRGNQDGGKASTSSSDKRSRQRHKSSSSGRRREEVEEGEKGRVEGGVYAQVVAFVRGLLNPLYKARLIPKDRFKAIVQRSSQKIMDRHKDALDASFLLHEHEAIRRFVLKMVEASQ